MPQRTCEELECDRPHRARGLCSAHWKQEHGTPIRYDIVCIICGSRHRSARRDGRFCSLTCRDLWRVDQPDDPMWHKLPLGRLGRTARLCPLPKSHPARWYGALDLLAYGSCRECSTLTCSSASNLKTYCGQACRNRVRNRKKEQTRRARRMMGSGGGKPMTGPGRTRQAIPKSRRMKVYLRDMWVCWLCGERTSSQYQPYDQWSPTLDHLLPHSLGGSDDEDNLATAHLWCNRVRSVGDMVTMPPPPLPMHGAA